MFIKIQSITTSTENLGQEVPGHWGLPGHGCGGRLRPPPGCSEAWALFHRGPPWRRLSTEASCQTGLSLSFWPRLWARQQREGQLSSQTRGEVSVPALGVGSEPAPFPTNPERSRDLRDRLYICRTTFITFETVRTTGGRKEQDKKNKNSIQFYFIFL